MATTNRNFKVKHGLDVADSGTFGGTVTVATPTQNTHAATKLYVDTAVGTPTVPIESTPPESAVNGELYFDSSNSKLAVYYSGQWITLATYNDTLELQQHIHDTAIDGTGLVVSILKDAGYYNEGSGTPEDAGFYNTNSWIATWDGGIAIDNFN